MGNTAGIVHVEVLRVKEGGMTTGTVELFGQGEGAASSHGMQGGGRVCEVPGVLHAKLGACVVGRLMDLACW